MFYSVVGIAMGGISDRLSRKKVMAFGLALWSSMTALGGAATNFAVLSVARIGVGVGEAAANPCSHSLLADIFPARNRALALGTYLTGTYVGGALALVLGGVFVQHWDTMCTAVPIGGACGISGWQAALFAVGLPGLPVAAALLLIREPERPAHGQGTGSVVLREFATALPPFTLLTVHRLGGARALQRNLLLAAAVIVVAALLVQLTGDLAQWSAFALGVYAVVTWGQVQSHRDKPLYALTFGDPTFVMATGAVALIACVGGGVGVWAAPYAMRTFAMSPTEIGLWLGIIHTAGALVGVIAGGWATDRWKQRDLRAPVFMSAIALAGIVPASVAMLLIKDVPAFLVAYGVIAVFGSIWGGAVAAMVQDLVLPRMRGSAAASYSLVAIVVSSGLGPYWAGKVSAMTGSLTTGMLSVLLLAIPAAVLLWTTGRRLPHETFAARAARAAAAGEPA